MWIYAIVEERVGDAIVYQEYFIRHSLAVPGPDEPVRHERVEMIPTDQFPHGPRP